MIFKLPYEQAGGALNKWVAWARRGRVSAFVKLQKTIVKHRAAILAAIEHSLSNGRVEFMNTKTRLINRIAFGFTSPRRPHRPRYAQPRRPQTRRPQQDLNPRKSQESHLKGS